MCGKGGVLYLVEGKPYCPACMYEKRPPLSYDGPERRRRPVSTPFTRRGGDGGSKRSR
jgi:hypothetical protein